MAQIEEPKINEKQEVISELLGFSFQKLRHTIIELTIRPGQTIASYCDGDRGKLVAPITYFLLTFGAGYILMSNTNLMNDSFDSGKALFNGNNTGASTFLQYQKKFPSLGKSEIEKMVRIADSTKSFLLSREGMLLQFVPIGVLSQYVFFRRFRKPFFHHAYLFLYTTGHLTFLTLPFMLPFLIGPTIGWVFYSISSLAGLLYFFYTELKFYPGINTETLVVRSLIQLLASIIPFIIWVAIVASFTYFYFLKTI